jgi:hypothetical protein
MNESLRLFLSYGHDGNAPLVTPHQAGVVMPVTRAVAAAPQWRAWGAAGLALTWTERGEP